MPIPFMRIEWNKYETALLVDAYERVASGEVSRKEEVKRLSDRLRNRLLMNGIGISDKYRNENGIAMQLSAIEFCMTKGVSGLNNPSKLFVEITTMAMEDRPSYELLLKDALELYPEPVASVKLSTPVAYEQGQKSDFGFIREGDDKKDMCVLSQIKEVLSLRFPKGFRLESIIELKRFRRFYSDFTGKDYLKSDDFLTLDIKECGIISDNKVFVPERILSNDVKRQIVSFIENHFFNGKRYIYYKTIFRKFENELLDSIIVDEKMLCTYLRYYYDDTWFFYKDYMTCEENVSIDIDDIVIEYVREQGRVVLEDELVKVLEYLPENEVRHSFNNHPSVLISYGRNQGRFHIDLFVVTQQELEAVSEIIDKAIEKYEFVGSDELISDIRQNVPSIITNNSVLSDYGIRKALWCKLEGRYSFNNAIISAFGHNLSSKEALSSFAKTHEEYSLDEIDSLADSLGTVINYYLESLLEYSIRINHDIFVSKSKVQFDVGAIDNAIDNWCSKSQPFFPLKSITNFSLFPETQYPWTQRLLESFLLTSSKHYTLLKSDFLNKNNICGAIVYKGYKELFDDQSMMKPFDSLLSIVLVRDNIPLTKDIAIAHLASEGYIVQRRYSQIEQVLGKAKAIKENKNN